MLRYSKHNQLNVISVYNFFTVALRYSNTTSIQLLKSHTNVITHGNFTKKQRSIGVRKENSCQSRLECRVTHIHWQETGVHV
jgi:hypothetical protein